MARYTHCTTGWWNEAAQDMEKGALTTAARSNDGDELSILDNQTHILDSIYAAVTA